MPPMALTRQRSGAPHGPRAACVAQAGRLLPYGPRTPPRCAANVNTTTLLRQINASRCLRLLRGGRALSRSEIARELNVTRTTAGNAVKLLVDEGLVCEPDGLVEAARVGRPSVGVSLNPSGAFFVGLSIETTALTALLVDLSMATLATIVEPLGPDDRDVEAVATRLTTMAERVMRRAGPNRDRIRGIGISIPGLVDRRGFIKSAPFLEWRDVDLRGRLRTRFGEGLEIRVCNDAVALARAICATAGEADTREFLTVLMSEGIGSALVQQGRVVEGANGYAGELGQMVMAATCGQGRRDTFQLLAGHRFFLPFMEQGRPVIDALADLAETGSTAPEFEAALQLWADRLTAGFLNAIRLLDPERIVLGGPVSRLFPRVAERVRANLFEELLGVQAPPITVCAFGAEGAAVGAAATLREDLFALPTIDEA